LWGVVNGPCVILEQNATEGMGIPDNGLEPLLAGEEQVDLLRMLFVCCDDAIPVESQLALALPALESHRDASTRRCGP
jgi:predicted RNA polymerase sigma factor